jgi:hypothetical protein
MNDKRAAIEILADAGRQVDGGKDIHGPVLESYSMVGELWGTYIRHINIARRGRAYIQELTIEAEDVLELMSLLKKARNAYSPQSNPENFADDVGYVALAGMVAQATGAPDEIPAAKPMPRVNMVDLGKRVGVDD